MSADALEPVALGRRPHAGTLLAIWVVLLVAIPSALVVGPLGSAGSPAQLVGLVAGGWWLAYQVQRSRARLTPSEPTRTAMAVFAAAMIASYVAATSRPIEGIELSAADRGLLVILSLWGVTLLTTDGLVSRANLDSLLRLLVWLTAAAAAVGCLQFFTGATIVDRIDIPGLSANKDIIGSLDRNGFARVLGTSMHPIEFGMLLATVLPIALHYAARDTDRSRWKRYTPVVLICAALPLTMSRSAVLGVAVLLIVLFPTWSKRQRLLALGGVVVGTCVVYVAVPGLVGTMVRLFTGISDDSSAQSRTDSYSLALQFVSRSPITGRGLSTFLPSYRILDNQYLGTLVGSGILGLVALLALVVTVLVQARRMSHRLASPDDRLLARALMASVAAGAVACATFDAFGFPQTAGTFFFAIGCIGALRRHAAGAVVEAAAGAPEGSRDAPAAPRTDGHGRSVPPRAPVATDRPLDPAQA